MGIESKRELGVIAGATGYLGSILASHYATLGINLILIGRNADKLKQLKQRIHLDSKVEVDLICTQFIGDLHSEIGQVIALRQEQLKFMINAIGDQNPIGPFLESSNEDWELCIETNLVIPSRLIRLFAGVMVKNRFGAIIQVSGGGAAASRANFSSYAAAKAGLVRLVETIAMEIQDSNVTINAIAPGQMPSQMMQQIEENAFKAGEEEVRKAREILSINNWDSTNTVNLCNFLTHDNIKGITGKLISSNWDNWVEWPQHIAELENSDLYTLRRVIGRDRGKSWGDL